MSTPSFVLLMLEKQTEPFVYHESGKSEIVSIRAQNTASERCTKQRGIDLRSCSDLLNVT
jgi:hypothetical protein